MYCLFFFLDLQMRTCFPVRSEIFSVFHKINENPDRSIESCQQMRCVGHILYRKVRLIFVLMLTSPSPKSESQRNSRTWVIHKILWDHSTMFRERGEQRFQELNL